MTREQEIYIRGLIALYETTVEVYDEKIGNLPVKNVSYELYGQCKAYKDVIQDLKKFLEMENNNE